MFGNDQNLFSFCRKIEFFHIFQPTVEGEWVPWSNRVPQIEVETHKVGSPDVVVPTLDTVRHESLLYTWLSEHKPLVLCGPPGEFSSTSPCLKVTFYQFTFL